MNKEKTLKILKELKETIKHNLQENKVGSEDLYINSWVLGSLEILEDKLNKKYIYSYYGYNGDTTYKGLFKSLLNFFFCRNCNPTIKIYVIGILFNTKIIKLLVDLYYSIFTNEQIHEMLDKYTYTIHSLTNEWQIRFEFMRQWSKENTDRDVL